MITIFTLFIFTATTLAAAKYAWWGPHRRLQRAVERRLKGLRVENAAGPRPRSILREQQLSNVSLFHHLYVKLEIMRRLQAIIDQAKLPYRAGNVVTLSAMLLASGFFAADVFHFFPFLILEGFFSAASSTIPLVYILFNGQRRMRRLASML